MSLDPRVVRRAFRTAFLAELLCALLLVVLALSCTATRYEPLNQYSPLKCRGLEASYPDRPPMDQASSSPALDPSLGWERAIGARCEPNSAPRSVVCRELSFYARSQERPLSSVDGDQAVRAIYRHSLGSSVVIRVFRAGGQAYLVAKALEHRGGPLQWITTRRLSDDEWALVWGAAVSLPKGLDSYQSLAGYDLAKARRSDCYRHDGAVLRIERFDRGVLYIRGVAYEPPPCSGQCCDREAEAASRFLGRLVELVGCEQAER
jgi:hypothetical protein